MDRQEILRQSLTDTEAAAAVAREYEVAQALRDATIKTASAACGAALRCGAMLLEMKARKKGEFLLWLHSYCPKISESTAKNYMRIAKLRESLGDASIDLQSVRQFYQLAGIMPPREPQPRSDGAQILQFWSFTTKIENWLPLMPDTQKSRFREWWESVGRGQGWM